MTIYKKKQSLKQLWQEALEGQKAARQRKHTIEKGKTLTLGSNLAVVEGGGDDGDEVADGWEPGVPITSPCDSVMVSAL